MTEENSINCILKKPWLERTKSISLKSSSENLSHTNETHKSRRCFIAVAAVVVLYCMSSFLLASSIQFFPFDHALSRAMLYTLFLFCSLLFFALLDYFSFRFSFLLSFFFFFRLFFLILFTLRLSTSSSYVLFSRFIFSLSLNSIFWLII